MCFLLIISTTLTEPAISAMDVPAGPQSRKRSAHQPSLVLHQAESSSKFTKPLLAGALCLILHKDHTKIFTEYEPELITIY